MMNASTRKVLTLSALAALLGVSFALGYLTGNKRHPQVPAEIPNTLSSTDMDHAFGTIMPKPHDSEASESMAMSLSGLVAGLEKKVAANPENIDQQLLLAQTYNELDSRDKSLKLMRALNKQVPKNVQVKITFATILMKSDNKLELKEASDLFEESIKLKPDVASMARMYQGEIRVKMDGIK